MFAYLRGYRGWAASSAGVDNLEGFKQQRTTAVPHPFCERNLNICREQLFKLVMKNIFSFILAIQLIIMFLFLFISKKIFNGM